MEYLRAAHKIDGYRNIFEKNGKPRVFAKDGLRVQVVLWFFNQTDKVPPAEYARYWTSDVGAVFDE